MDGHRPEPEISNAVGSEKHGSTAADSTLLRDTVRFAGAITLTMLAALLLQMWIVMFLGWQGPDALYVRSIYTPIGYLTLAVSDGLMVASQVAAGIATRNGERHLALRLAPTFLLVGAGVLGLLALVLAVGSDPILNALAVPEGERGAIVAFAVAMCLSGVVGLVPMVCNAVQRGVGRARLAATFSVANVVLSVLAMLALDGAGLGIIAAPAGGAIAAIVVGVPSLLTLRRQGIVLPRWRPRVEGFRNLLAIGAPVAGSYLLLSTSMVGYLRVLRNAGTDEIAGFSVAQTVVTFFMVGAIATGSGTAIAVNLRPADSRTRINVLGLRTALYAVIPTYVLVAVVAFAIRGPMSDLLTSSPPIADVTADYFAWVAPTLITFGGVLAILTYLEQVGLARWALVLNAAYFAVLLSIAFALPQPVHSTDMARLIAGGNVIGFATLLVAASYLVRRPAPDGSMLTP